MRCDDVIDLLGLYWDLQLDDDRRNAMERHIEHCSSCEEEFTIWQESNEMIRNSQCEFDFPEVKNSISDLVMDRIYADEAWKIPAKDKLYTFSKKMRTVMGTLVACCLLVSFLSITFALANQQPIEENLAYSSAPVGIHPVAEVSYDQTKVSERDTKLFHAVASINEPVKLEVSQTLTIPNSIIVVVFVSFISAIFILNWLSRLKG